MKGKTSSSGATCKPLITDERILHGIIDGSFIPTFVIDRDHCVQHWNRALEEISKIPASSIIGTNEHWRAFYRKQRPCMADLLVDGAMQEIPRWYAGKVRESALIPEAFEATDFFAELGESGRWLRFTAHPDAKQRRRDRRRRGDSRGHHGPEAGRGGAQGEPAAALPDPRGLPDRGVCDRPGPPGDLLEPGPGGTQPNPRRRRRRDGPALEGLLRVEAPLHGRSDHRRETGRSEEVVCREGTPVETSQGGLRGDGFLLGPRRGRPVAALHGGGDPEFAGRPRGRRGDPRGHHGAERPPSRR